MKLNRYEGKNVQVICNSGKTFLGKVTDYISAEDNEPEGESIILRTLQGVLIEFRPEEIKVIEVFV